MALKDVKKYFQQVESQYHEMFENIKDLQEAYDQGIVSEEQFNQYSFQIQQIKQNYDRLGYIMYLFTLPKRDKKKNKLRNEGLENYFSLNYADEKAVLKEDSDALKVLKTELRELKESDKRK